MCSSICDGSHTSTGCCLWPGDIGGRSTNITLTVDGIRDRSQPQTTSREYDLAARTKAASLSVSRQSSGGLQSHFIDYL